MLRLLIPVAALMIPFLGMWLIGDYIGGSGGGTTVVGNGSDGGNVTLGMLMLLASGAGAGAQRYLLPILLALSATGAVVFGSMLLGPAVTIAVSIAAIIGLLFWGLIIIIGLLTPLGTAISSLLFRVGLIGYRRPTRIWTRQGYKLRDWARIPDHAKADREPTFYRAFGSRVGFSFDPQPSSWPERIEHDKLRQINGEMQADVETDGGAATLDIQDPSLPSGYTGSDELRRARGYAGYVPEDVDDETVYVNSGVALQRLNEAATGKKSLRELLAAKEEHGGQAMSSSAELWWLIITAGLGLVSFASGLFVFLL
jgi:hypothetical protein